MSGLRHLQVHPYREHVEKIGVSNTHTMRIYIAKCS